jgi:tetratricopeptide (TPR) repeat protein
MRRRLLTGALIVPALAGFMVLWEGLNASSGSSLSDTLRLRGESSSQRLLLAWIAGRLWEDAKLTGIGPGEFRLRFLPEINRILSQPESGSFRGRIEKMKSFKPVHVHNDYLETWTEWGCLGYASAAAFLISLMAPALRRHREELGLRESASLKPSGLVWRGLLGGVFVCLAYAALEFPFHLPVHLSLFATFLGFACSPVAGGAAPSQGGASRRPPAVLKRFPLAAALAILSAGLIWNGLSLYHASRLIKTATDLVVTQPALRDRASTLARRASLLDPSNVKIRLALAQIQWRVEGLPSVARSTLRQAAPVSDDPSLRLVESEILLGEGKFDEAARTLQAFDEVGRFLPGVGYLEGRIAEWRKRDELAAQSYQRDLTALGNHPGIPHQHLPDLYLRYGGVLERLGQYKQAIAMYQKHQDLLQGRQTNIPLGLLKMGILYRDRLEDYTSARKCFEQALEAARKSGGPGEIDNARNELQLLHSRVETLKASAPVILDATGENP